MKAVERDGMETDKMKDREREREEEFCTIIVLVHCQLHALCSFIDIAPRTVIAILQV